MLHDATSGHTAPNHTTKEGLMSSTDDAKGRVKEAVGDLTDDDNLKREGQIDRATGKVKETVDDAAGKVKDAASGDH